MDPGSFEDATILMHYPTQEVFGSRGDDELWACLQGIWYRREDNLCVGEIAGRQMIWHTQWSFESKVTELEEVSDNAISFLGCLLVAFLDFKFLGIYSPHNMKVKRFTFRRVSDVSQGLSWQIARCLASFSEKRRRRSAGVTVMFGCASDHPNA